MHSTKLARRTLLATGGMATALWQAGMPVVTQSHAQSTGGGLPSAAELYAMAAAKQAINNAFLPSGSDAHKTWVSQLARALTAAGVQNVTTPPFTFTQWSPTSWSLTIQNGRQQDDIDVAGYVPYSGSTPPGGITAQLTYLGGVTGFFGPPPAGKQATTLSADFMGFPLNVSVNGQTLAQGITNLGVDGKIVMLDLPTPTLPLQDVLSGAFFVDNANKTIPNELGVAGLTGLFFTNAFAAALLGAGALGIVAVVPFRRFWANNYYFSGTIAGIPILLVDAEEGARLKDVIADSGKNGPYPSATLTLTAEVNASATLPSLLGVIPGQSEKLIILNSHSDSANIIEEIGPIVIWGLARYLAGLPLSARPYTIQIMIEGSHLVGDLDERAYITANSTNLMQNALVDVTIEHLGGRELMQFPSSGQVPLLDGLLETNWLSVGPIPGTTTFSDPIVRATIALAQKLGRSFVAPTSLVGLGISGPWRAVTTTTASIDQPAWLLNIDMPDHLELNRLMDFQALQTAVEGYAEMLTTFMNTPVADFSKAYVA
jgi:hypothetical protein